MGFRFRKTVNLGKGLRLNLSKSGISTSVGPRGASMTFGKNGTYANLGIPGTGISYHQRIGGKKKATQRGSENSSRQTIAEYTGDPHYAYLVTIDDGGKIEIRDSDGRPIADPALIALIRKDPDFRKNKAQLELRYNQNMLEKSLAQANAMSELLCIHEGSPRIKDRQDYERALAELKPQGADPRSMERFEKKKRRLKAALAGTPSFIERKSEKWLEVCSLPLPIRASYEYEPSTGKLSMDLDLPEIEDIPSTYIDQLASGEYREKNKPKKRVNEEYERFVKSLCVYVAANLFNVSIEIHHIVLSGYTERRSKDGSVNSEYIISIDFARDGMRTLSYASDDPLATIMNFENRQNVTSSGVMKAIEPL